MFPTWIGLAFGPPQYDAFTEPMSRHQPPGPLGLSPPAMCYQDGASLFTYARPVGPVGLDACSLPALLPRRPGQPIATASGLTGKCSGDETIGISPEQGQLVVDAARSFVGADYFSGGGERSTEDRMDCSGAVWLAYRKAGLPTRYHDSRSFPGNRDFFRVPDQRPQQGDVGQWSGHMLIYDAHAGGRNNGWSARRPGVAFSAQSTEWWAHLGSVTWFRYKFSRTCVSAESP